MYIKFWGTRGSIPVPGPTTVRYGGNTSCVELRTKQGTLIILDCGTGLHRLGKQLIEEYTNPIEGHILITHTHWDHIQGLPFFAPLFVAGNAWDFYAPKGFEKSLKETLGGQMQYTYFPVSLAQLQSDIKYHELLAGEFLIKDITVKARYLNHPATTLGYRLQENGISIVYATDHEPYTSLAGSFGILSEKEQEHIEFLANADLVIHDSQYLSSEYREKRGWGHSTIEYVVAVCAAARVKKIAFTHHDPLRNDDSIDLIVANIKNKLKKQSFPLEVCAAFEGQIIKLE